MEQISTYPLDNFYSYIKTNKRVSALTPPSGNLAEKVISYFKENDPIESKSITYSNDISGILSRTYQISGTTLLSLEPSTHFINSTLFNISRIRIGSQDRESNFIKAKTTGRTIDLNIVPAQSEVNIGELVKSTKEYNSNSNEGDWNVNFDNADNKQKVKLNISRDIEIGYRDTKASQLIKIINNSGKNLTIGSNATDNVKIEFTNAYNPANILPLATDGSLYYIDYDIYKDKNKLISPSAGISNLWLLGSRIMTNNGVINYENNHYWKVSADWLKSETNKSHIEYLTRPKPVFRLIDIVNGTLPASNLVDYYRNVQPRGFDGQVKISNTAVLQRMSFNFDSNTNRPHHLLSTASDGQIDYVDGKCQILYPNGYKELLVEKDGRPAGSVEMDNGGLLNLIRKGVKITFVETRNPVIRVIPTAYSGEGNSGEITEAIVECNEVIFD